jgi:hypothetical protein
LLTAVKCGLAFGVVGGSQKINAKVNTHNIAYFTVLQNLIFFGDRNVQKPFAKLIYQFSRAKLPSTVKVFFHALTLVF